MNATNAEQKPRGTGRRLRMTLLLSLIMGWASILHLMEESGTLADYIYVETIAQTPEIASR
jgi:hypothetical protein